MAGIALTLLLLAAVAGYALRLARPASEAVRLRNAWRLQPSERSDFAWIPPQFPPGFNVERRPATEEFRAIAATVGVGAIDGDWNKALALAQHLTERAEDKGAIQADPSTSYRLIRRGYGYCADFVKVFLALAHASGLCARQWGFSFDGFGGHGHTIVELFDRQRGRWVMVDVYNNFHFVDAETGEQFLAPGETGEIILRAPQLMSGYWNNPAETAAALRRHGDGGPWLHTGDLGYLDADSYMFIVDRQKDLIKTSGYQVWPREVEEAIASHPAVSEVGVAGIPDAKKGEAVKAWVVLRAGQTVSEADLRAFCRDTLAPYKVPSHIDFRENLPKTMVGKVLRRALRDGG